MTIPTLPLDPNSQAPDTSKILGNKETGAGSNFVPPEELEKLQKEVQQAQNDLEDNKFLNRSIQAYEASDKYFNGSIRPKLNDSIKSYNNQHTSGSVFAMDNDPSNSRIFRPKTRTILRKYAAAATSSFFSNLDIVSIEAENASDKAEVISAAITKALVNYRLRKHVPWYQICTGGFTDALVQGLVCAHIYWNVDRDEEGNLINEKPVVDLIPLENIRFDAASDWTDIVNSTPFLIILKPMYVGDVKQDMAKGKFNKLSDADIAASFSRSNSNTVKERNAGGRDPYADNAQSGIPNDYQTVVVQMHIHRIDGQDWLWYTLNNTAMLTDPVPLQDVYFHGKRPFVIGAADVDPHNAYVTPLPELLQPTQEEMNILANQRRTNVDMAMNRKWRVEPSVGDRFDPMALLDNAVGSLVFAPKDGLEALDVPDVTQSSYLEQQGLDRDFDELAGNYAPQPSQVGNSPNDSHKQGQMLNTNANVLVEMALKTYTMTFVEPVLRMIVLLEQYYETDDVIVGLAGMQAGLFMRYNGKVQWSVEAAKLAQIPSQQPQAGQPAPQGQPGQPAPQQQPQQGQPGLVGMPQPQPSTAPSGALPHGISVSDLLNKELTIKVNVGLNATDPERKLQKFLFGITSYIKTFGPAVLPTLDKKEIFAEMMALSGYGDGSRFMDQNLSPEKTQIMQLTQLLNQKNAPLQTKLQIAREGNASREKIKAAEIKKDEKVLLADNLKFVAEHSAEMHQAQSSHAEAPAATTAAPEPGQG